MIGQAEGVGGEGMPLNIDSSRALRSPRELADLVQAVLAASENDESAWIEWKNGLVLREKATRVEIARHILGMANRRPEDAARHAEGCGYIIIGAEPGLCGGVTEIDPADLDAGLQPYLGSAGPRWSAQYVKVQDKSILVITIDPPRRGDRSFTLHREYGKYLPGMIFVRRPGRTVQAEPGDIRDLEDRYAAADNPITLHVRPSGADDNVRLLSVSDIHLLLDNWEQQERADLLAPVNISAAVDGRTDEEYQEEIEEYIVKFRDYVPKYVAAQVAEHSGTMLSLALNNASDRNYIEVGVEIHIARPMTVFDPDGLEDLPACPSRPRKRGMRRRRSPYELFSRPYGFPSKIPVPTWPKFHVDYREKCPVISYDIKRVRPEQCLPLDPVLVLGLDEPAGEVELAWRVTASNVDGIAHGTFLAKIAAPIKADDLIRMPNISA